MKDNLFQSFNSPFIDSFNYIDPKLTTTNLTLLSVELHSRLALMICTSLTSDEI